MDWWFSALLLLKYLNTQLTPHYNNEFSYIVLTGDLRDHSQEGEGEEVHGGYEWAVVEPAAWRAPAQCLAQRPARDSGGPHAAQTHWHAIGLWGRDVDLLWWWPDPTLWLPLCLHTGVVPCLLDRRGSQHNPVLHVSPKSRKHFTGCSVESLHDDWIVGSRTDGDLGPLMVT